MQSPLLQARFSDPLPSLQVGATLIELSPILRPCELKKRVTKKIKISILKNV